MSKKKKKRTFTECYGGITSTSWGYIKATATKGSKKKEFTITAKEAWELFIEQKGLCVYTSMPLHFGNGWGKAGHFNRTASIDRIDSSLGYVTGNIQWVHKIINLMKNDMSGKEFVEWCCKVCKNDS